jgi:DHA1 family bicyclomycin/chloramphenicol resistance-like MFS transporter
VSERAQGNGRLLAVLGAVYALAPLAIDMYLPGLPALSHGLHASASQGQLTLTACLLGLGVGQVYAGPLSDARGRRGPLLGGMIAFTLASAACAIAPSIWALVALRFAEGLAGAVGMVICLAVIRDSFEGHSAARGFALLILVSGTAPVVAPLLGAEILHLTSWRGMFVGLAAVGGVMSVAVAGSLPETLPPGARQPAGFAHAVRTLAALFRDRRFTPYAAIFALMFGAMFAYIAGSAFVLEDIYGLSPTLYSVVFAANAAGLVTLAQLGRRLGARAGAARLLRAGLTLSALGAAGTLVVAVTHAGLAFAIVSFAALIAANGLNVPNSAALALDHQGERAGSASALLGLGQFTLGAAVAPLVGLAGAHTMVPMALVIAACAAIAVAIQLALGRR